MPRNNAPRQWTDRLGNTQRELAYDFPGMPKTATTKVTSSLATAWERASEQDDGNARRQEIIAEALAQKNPIIEEDPLGDPAHRLYTWVVEAPGAESVLLCTNSLFEPEQPSPSEMTHLEGSDYWVHSFRMPASWRSSYSIVPWLEKNTPIWRQAGIDRRELWDTLMRLGQRDLRSNDSIMSSSVVAGPTARPDLWSARSGKARVVEETIAGTRAWMYCPEVTEKTPLLVLFDGQKWNGLIDLPNQIDAAIKSGMMPPVHVLMLDSGDNETRWDSVGVPGGQIDALIDELLPYIRAHYPVLPTGDRTIVSGVSFGGLAALWAVALAQGEVGHAIAFSPSLWRFNLADALTSDPAWQSISLHTGTLEGDMLDYSTQLAEDLSSLDVPLEIVVGGHDWAWWRVHLLTRLTELLKSF